MAADIGTLLTISERLYNVIQSSAMKEIRDYKKEMEKLIDTINSIKSMFLDAERRRNLTHGERGWIEKLRDVLYDADDLLDEFDTIGRLKKDSDPTLLNKVGDFFTLENPLIVAYRTRKKINEIRDTLDEITRNHKNYKLMHNEVEDKSSGRWSYVDTRDVIGREDSVKVVVDMLLNFRDKEVSFVTIVGAGGVGKTTLAKLVYKNESVIKKFALRMWISVSDHQVSKPFELEVIFGTMLELITKRDFKGIEINRLQEELEKELRGKTFMLVLDDVWTDDCHKWNELRNFLNIGGKGSGIVVTSRMKMANSVNGNIDYELQVLTPENSWILFQKIALEGKEQIKYKNLFKIGKRIVGKCCDNPLAITMVGHLLSCKKEDQWQSICEKFESVGIVEGEGTENRILSILKLSYNNLEHSLKSCFSYCALFPKDVQIGKEMIISLWIAQGYIVPPFLRGQSIENAAEEYFSILLQRCFFQDVRINEYGTVESCKIHNLMHDVAKEVTRKEICLRSSLWCSSDRHNYRHLYDDDQSSHKRNFFRKAGIRSYLQSIWALSFPVDTLIENWVHLRALDLHGTGISILPTSISNLKHLRYLDLSWNGFLITLPNSIVKLHNLQFLNLDGCFRLKELPSDMRRLTKLRYLNLNDCNKLASMPPNVAELVELRVLTTFIVSYEEPRKEISYLGQLEDLKKLVNLRGKIDIFIYCKNIKEEAFEEGYLSNLKHLEEVSIHFLNTSVTSGDHERRVVGNLKPNPKLKGIRLMGYTGLTIPNLITDNNYGIILPNIIKIELAFCENVKYIPSLSHLHHLKRLRLRNLWMLEYMESTSVSSEAATFFPSLKELEIRGLPKMKGWWRKEEPNQDNCVESALKMEVSFPCLNKLLIEGCYELVSLPPCQSLDVLHLTRSNKRLRIKLVKHHIVRDLKIDNECYRKHFDSNTSFWPFWRLTLVSLCLVLASIVSRICWIYLH